MKLSVERGEEGGKEQSCIDVEPIPSTFTVNFANIKQSEALQEEEVDFSGDDSLQDPNYNQLCEQDESFSSPHEAESDLDGGEQIYNGNLYVRSTTVFPYTITSHIRSFL